MYKTSFEITGTKKLVEQVTYDIIRYCYHENICVEHEFVGKNSVLFRLSCEDYKKEKVNNMISKIQGFEAGLKNLSDLSSDCGLIIKFWIVILVGLLIYLIIYSITH
jgi:hypothetical protein